MFLQVCRDPRWGRCYESYSEDPKVVRAMTEIIPGLQGDIPSGSRKGVPFVAGKYESVSPPYFCFSTQNIIYVAHFSKILDWVCKSGHKECKIDIWLTMK